MATKIENKYYKSLKVIFKGTPTEALATGGDIVRLFDQAPCSYNSLITKITLFKEALVAFGAAGDLHVDLYNLQGGVASRLVEDLFAKTAITGSETDDVLIRPILKGQTDLKYDCRVNSLEDVIQNAISDNVTGFDALKKYGFGNSTYMLSPPYAFFLVFRVSGTGLDLTNKTLIGEVDYSTTV